MKIDDIYNKITCIDTLLSFDGIISSLPDFQLKLVTLIEQFHQSLMSEQKNEDESDNLCRVICFYLDKRVSSRLDRNFSSWDGFLLEKYFYGYDKDKHSIYYRINSLMKTNDSVIYAYAYKLLSDLSYIIGYNEELTTLLYKHNKQDAYSPSPTRIPANKKLIRNNEQEIINISKKTRNWIHNIVLQVGISVVAIAIFWSCCNNYINSFQ